MRASVTYLLGIDIEEVMEVCACINPLLDFMWTSMVTGWLIYNAAMVSMCVISHRWRIGLGSWSRKAVDSISGKPWTARSVTKRPG